MGVVIDQLLHVSQMNLLILAGFAFLAVAAIGRVAGKIEPRAPARIICGVLGLGLILYGLSAPRGARRVRSASPNPPGGARVYSQGAFSIRQTGMANFDRGSETTGPDSDVWFEAVSTTERYLVPQQGAAMALVGLATPTQEHCRTLPLSTARIPVNDLPVGANLCIRTHSGHFGRFRITAPVGPSPGVLQVSYITWE